MTGQARFDRELKMTVHASKLLTPEEFASLIEIALSSPSPTIPALHLSKLIGLGYVIVTAKGPHRHRRRPDPDYRERITAQLSCLLPT